MSERVGSEQRETRDSYVTGSNVKHSSRGTRARSSKNKSSASRGRDSATTRDSYECPTTRESVNTNYCPRVPKSLLKGRDFADRALFVDCNEPWEEPEYCKEDYEPPVPVNHYFGSVKLLLQFRQITTSVLPDYYFSSGRLLLQFRLITTSVPVNYYFSSSKSFQFR